MLLKRFILFFFILLVTTLIDFFYLGRPVVGIDDANISMNYALHLTQGEGFVFNHGGEKVEGFTSLLWVLFISFFYKMSSHPEMLMMGFLLILATCTVSLVYGEVKKDVGRLHPAFCRKYFLWIFSGFLVCIGPSYVVWSVLSLMENGLWNFIFAVNIVLLLQILNGRNDTVRKLLLLLAGILLLLTRPEAMFWCLLISLLLLLVAGRKRSGYVFPMVYFMVLGVATVALTLYRNHYFGYPLPNTYYAKVSGDEWYNIREGILYLTNFITNYHPLLTFLLLLLVTTSITGGFLYFKVYRAGDKTIWSQQVFWRIMLITCMIIVTLLLPLITGGDHFGGFRFYQGCFLFFIWGVPSLLFLLVENSPMIRDKKIQLVGLSLGVTFLLLTAGTINNLKDIPETRLGFEFELASNGRKNAEFLNQLWKDNKPSVGMITVGGFSLKYEGKTVDLMGLNNTIMGHNKGDRKGIKNHAAFNKEIFYQLHPDMLLPKIIDDEARARMHFAELIEKNSFDNQALKYMLNDSAFLNSYHPVLLKKDDRNLFVFISKDMEARMVKDTSLVLTQLRF